MLSKRRRASRLVSTVALFASSQELSVVCSHRVRLSCSARVPLIGEVQLPQARDHRPVDYQLGGQRR